VGRLLGFAITGLLFGAAISHIPSPDDPRIFWVANFSAPWALLPFVAGRFQPSWRLAALSGLVADVACVAGFYAGFITADAGRLGLSASTPQAELVLTGLVRWITFIAPWVVLAVGAGATYGLLGCWWGRSRAAPAAVAVVAPFVVEPLAWWLYRGFVPAPVYLWAVELAVGGAILAWTMRKRRLALQ
jgi:hypothetical protein